MTSCGAGVACRTVASGRTHPECRINVKRFPFHENCAYNQAGFTCTVPPGNYFMMGDKRDSSLIYWNFDEFKRIGHTTK